MNKIKKLIRKIMWKLCGLQNIQNQLDAIHYFINNNMDIKQFPKATGDLRLLQEADYWWLCIFDKICKKHNLIYWLDWGTLLGAVRHGGFIPWDDDMDIAMPREDFEKMIVILKDELPQEHCCVKYFSRAAK